MYWRVTEQWYLWVIHLSLDIHGYSSRYLFHWYPEELWYLLLLTRYLSHWQLTELTGRTWTRSCLCLRWVFISIFIQSMYVYIHIHVVYTHSGWWFTDINHSPWDNLSCGYHLYYMYINESMKKILFLKTFWNDLFIKPYI